MSFYQKAFASFLAKTFYPVNVSFKSLPIIYSNPLFSVSYKIHKSRYPLIGYELSIDNSKREKEFLNSFSGLEKDKGVLNGISVKTPINYLTDIKFDYAINKYHKSRYVNNNKLNTPESFIKCMLDKPKDYTSFELKNKDKNNNIVEFNTNGLIPLRYLDMINDFSLYKFNYVMPNELDIKLYESELFEKIIDFNDKMLFDIYQYAKYLSEKEQIIKIIVSKAPRYPIDNEFIKKYNFGTFRIKETEDYLHKNILECIWYSGDGDFSSPSTKMFFNRTKEYKSLNNIGYNKLFSSSGGIDFSYVSQLPWFELKRKMGDIQPYYDVSGQNTYLSNFDDIGISEFIIFSEALAKEGAEFTLTIQ